MENLFLATVDNAIRQTVFWTEFKETNNINIRHRKSKSEYFNRRNDSIDVSGTALVRLTVLAHESTSFIYN